MGSQQVEVGGYGWAPQVKLLWCLVSHRNQFWVIWSGAHLTYIFDEFTFWNGHFCKGWESCCSSIGVQIVVPGPLIDDLKQHLPRQHLCKCSFSWSRLHLSSCSPTGSVEDRGVLTTILSGWVINLYDLKQLLLRELHCKWPFSLSRLHPSSCSPNGSLEDQGVLTTILSG